MPLQSRKAGEVAVVCDPFTAPFDRQRRKPGVGDPASSGIGSDAQPLENIPMTLARLDDPAIGMGKEIVAKLECLLRLARIRKCASVRRDPDDGCQRH